MTDRKETTEVTTESQDNVIVLPNEESDFLNPDEIKGYEEWRANKIKSKSKPIDAW